MVLKWLQMKQNIMDTIIHLLSWHSFLSYYKFNAVVTVSQLRPFRAFDSYFRAENYFQNVQIFCDGKSGGLKYFKV